MKVSQKSVTEVWREYGDSAWLSLSTKSGSLSDFQAAVVDANVRDEDTNEGEVAGDFACESGDGFVVMLVRAGDEAAAAVRWATALADALAARGFDGSVGGARRATTPAMFAGPPVSTGFIAWVPDRERIAARASGWLVGADATARVSEHAARWARLPDARLYLQQKMFSAEVGLTDPAPPLARAVQQLGRAGVRYIVDPERRGTHVSLAYGGDGVYQTLGIPGGWQTLIDKLTEALVGLPADTQHAFIRRGRRAAASHTNIDVPDKLPNNLHEGDVRYNKLLCDRYLPDAHGVQVVRTAHLDNARDLSEWLISDLGSGRHLVQARDLAPWYATEKPDPTVVEAARHDFEGALLTKQIITDNGGRTINL